MPTGSWTGGDVEIGNVVREGNMTESFDIKDAPATRRQRGQGDFKPHIVVLHFGIYGGGWECIGVQAKGPTLLKDGEPGKQWHKAFWPAIIDHRDTEAPKWLVDLAMRRLAHIKYVPNKAPDDGTWP